MTAYTRNEWATFFTAFFITATVVVAIFSLGMYFGMYVTMPEIDDQPRTGYGYYQPVGDQYLNLKESKNEEGFSQRWKGR